MQFWGREATNKGGEKKSETELRRRQGEKPARNRGRGLQVRKENEGLMLVDRGLNGLTLERGKESGQRQPFRERE